MVKKSLIFLYILAWLFSCLSCNKNQSEVPREMKEKGYKFVEVKDIKELEPGLKTDFKWYLKTVNKLLENPKSVTLNADKYYKLWNNAYGYRDRAGAKIIADIIGMNNGSKFWHGCFLTLANGQEKTPASLESLTENDYSEKQAAQFVFTHLFTYSELKNCGFYKLRELAQLMQSTYNDGLLLPNFIVPPFYKNNSAGTLEDEFKWCSAELGDKGYVESSGVTITKITVANVAFRTCHYELGNKYLDDHINTNHLRDKIVVCMSGLCDPLGEVETLYYAGYSIHLEYNSSDPSTIYLYSDNGVRYKARNLSQFDPNNKTKVLLQLSKEREQLPWLKR